MKRFRGIVPECRTPRPMRPVRAGNPGLQRLCLLCSNDQRRNRGASRASVGRGEAERDPLHPIRVIPAREVSGKSCWRRFFESVPPVRAWRPDSRRATRAVQLVFTRIVCTAGFASRFRPWVRMLVAVRKGSDDRTFFTSISSLPDSGSLAGCFGVLCRARFRRARRRPVRTPRRVATCGRRASRGALRARRSRGR